jgi:hypothetical protein
MVRIHIRSERKRLSRDLADDLLGRSIAPNLFFEIRQRLNVKQRCDVR